MISCTTEVISSILSSLLVIMESVEQLNSHLKVLKQALLQEKDKRKENLKVSDLIKSQIRSIDDQNLGVVRDN